MKAKNLCRGIRLHGLFAFTILIVLTKRRALTALFIPLDLQNVNPFIFKAATICFFSEIMV